MLAVLSLAYFPFLFDAIAGVAGLTLAEPPFVYRTLAFIIRSLAVAMPLLVIVALSKDSWRSFGIVRPRWIVDIVAGVMIWQVAMVAYFLIMSLLPQPTAEGRGRPCTRHSSWDGKG